MASGRPLSVPLPSSSCAPRLLGLDLNISSMRSVTRKPPTTLIVPKAIAITRITLLKAPLPDSRRPTGRRAARCRGSRWCPTSAACAACSGTLEITTKPTKPASTRIARLVVTCSRGSLLPASRRAAPAASTAAFARVHDLAVAHDARALDDLVVEVQLQLAVLVRRTARAAPGRCARTAARRARPSSPAGSAARRS